MESPGEALMVQTTVLGRGKTPGLSRVDEGLFEAPTELEPHPNINPKIVPNMWAFPTKPWFLGDVEGREHI
jgi:hypothetical protein